MEQESGVSMHSDFPYGSAFPGFIPKSTALAHTDLLFHFIFDTPITSLLTLFSTWNIAKIREFNTSDDQTKSCINLKTLHIDCVG